MRILSTIVLMLLLAATSTSAQVVEWNQKHGYPIGHHWYTNSSYYYGNGHATPMATDKEGNIYAARHYVHHRSITKFAPDGTTLWTREGIGSGYAAAASSQVVLDSSGGVYLLDQYLGPSFTFEGITVTGGMPGCFSKVLWKFDKSGNVKWGKTIATFRDTLSWLYGSSWWHYNSFTSGVIQSDRAGNIFYYGSYEDSVTILGARYLSPAKRSAFLLKMNGNGSQVWLREMPNIDATWDGFSGVYAHEQSLAVTPSGATYFFVHSPFTFTFGDTVIPHRLDSMNFIVKVSPNGKLLWRKMLGARWSSQYDYYLRVALTCDANEDLYLVANDHLQTVLVGNDTLGFCGVAKISNAGPNLWHKRIVRRDSLTRLANNQQFYTPHSISMNGYGQMAVAIYTMDSTHFDYHVLTRKVGVPRGYWSSLVLQINDRGELIWADVLEGTGSNNPTAVAMRQDHGVYLAGAFGSSMVARDTLTGGSGYLLRYGGVHLTTPSPGKQEYCAGDTVQVHYAATRKFHPSNVYKAQLSDTGGVFNRRVQFLGELETNDSLGIISCVLPHNVVPGATYRIKVTGSDPYYDATNPGPEFIIHGPPPVAIRAKSKKLCIGEVMDLTGLNCSTYLWSTGDTTESITIDTGGRYIVTGYNHIGCEANDTIDVVSVPLPKAGLEIKGDTTFCEGGLMRLKASGGTAYLWSNEETSQEIVVRESGLYSAAVYNADGCVSETHPIRVTVLDAPDKPLIQQDSNTLISSSDSNNQWYYYGKAIDGANSDTLLATQNGRYVVRVTNDNGCYTESDVVNVTLGTSAVVAEGESPDRFVVFYAPEPVVIYQGTPGTPLRIELIDQLGSAVAILHDAATAGDLRLPIPQGLTSGVYYVRCSSEQEVRTLKVALTK